MRTMHLAGRIGRLLGVMCLGLWLTGCFPTAVITSEYLEARREATREFAAPVDRVWPATLQALRDLQIAVKDSIRDSTGGDIEGTWGAKGHVAVKVDVTGPAATRVRVSAGDFSNRDAPESILNRIAAVLQTMP
jgi:hypothetical protein